jgi:hypothetical protein
LRKIHETEEELEEKKGERGERGVARGTERRQKRS